MAVTENFSLKIGEEKNLKNGVRVKVADTEFESRQLNLPGVSAPATSRFTIVVEVSVNGLSEKLFFVPKSPGTVSMEQNQFQYLTILYVRHSYDAKQLLTVEFSAREGAIRRPESQSTTKCQICNLVRRNLDH